MCYVCTTAVIGSDCHTYLARRYIERGKTERKEYQLICEAEMEGVREEAGLGVP